jgi:hypothetical protein
MGPIIEGFGAMMKGRTGGLEGEGSPEGFGLPSLLWLKIFMGEFWDRKFAELVI